MLIIETLLSLSVLFIELSLPSNLGLRTLAGGLVLRVVALTTHSGQEAVISIWPSYLFSFWIWCSLQCNFYKKQRFPTFHFISWVLSSRCNARLPPPAENFNDDFPNRTTRHKWNQQRWLAYTFNTFVEHLGLLRPRLGADAQWGETQKF